MCVSLSPVYSIFSRWQYFVHRNTEKSLCHTLLQSKKQELFGFSYVQTLYERVRHNFLYFLYLENLRIKKYILKRQKRTEIFHYA